MIFFQVFNTEAYFTLKNCSYDWVFAILNFYRLSSFSANYTTFFKTFLSSDIYSRLELPVINIHGTLLYVYNAPVWVRQTKNEKFTTVRNNA